MNAAAAPKAGETAQRIKVESNKRRTASSRWQSVFCCRAVGQRPSVINSFGSFGCEVTKLRGARNSATGPYEFGAPPRIECHYHPGRGCPKAAARVYYGHKGVEISRGIAQLEAELLQELFLPAGDLNLRHAENLRRLGLGLVFVVSQHDEPPVPVIEPAHHLRQGDDLA